MAGNLVTWRAALAAALALALVPVAPPTAAAGEELSLADALRARIVADAGALPESVLVDDGTGARVLSWDEALALAEAFPAGGPSTPTTSPVVTGTRAGSNSCVVALIATVVSTDGEVEFEQPLVAVPDGAICGRFQTWVGDATARSASGDPIVLCGRDLWEEQTCAVGREGITMVGRVGYLKLRFCFFNVCYAIDQIFGGTANSPLPGNRDAAVGIVW